MAKLPVFDKSCHLVVLPCQFEHGLTRLRFPIVDDEFKVDVVCLFRLLEYTEMYVGIRLLLFVPLCLVHEGDVLALRHDSWLGFADLHSLGLSFADEILLRSLLNFVVSCAVITGDLAFLLVYLPAVGYPRLFGGSDTSYCTKMRSLTSVAFVNTFLEDCIMVEDRFVITVFTLCLTSY